MSVWEDDGGMSDAEDESFCFAGYGVEVLSARLLSLRNVGLHLLLVLCQV